MIVNLDKYLQEYNQKSLNDGKKLFKIPMLQRYTQIDPTFFTSKAFMVVDNIGIIVGYDSSKRKESDITDNIVRSHLNTKENVYDFLLANSKEEAIEKAKKCFPGLKIGGKSEASKILEIEYDKIEELPKCENMRIFNGTVRCDEDMQGYTDCIVQCNEEPFFFCSIIFDDEIMKYLKK